MSRENIIILVVFAIYMAFMIIVGFFFSTKSNSNKEYVLGGRQLNPWVTALSAQASDMSGWLLTGVPGMAFAAVLDAKSALYVIIGLFIGTWVNWLLVAKRLRVYTEVAGDSLTIPEYFVKRFDDQKGIIGFIAGVIILFFFTIYTASMFSAGAKLFQVVFGLDYKIGLVIGVVIVVSYTFLGGFKAVSWTDLFQGLIMFFALIIVPVIVYAKLASPNKEIVLNYTKEIFMISQSNKVPGLDVINSIGWGLGYFGMPHILVRFMATKDKRTIKPARIIAIIWVAITMVAALFIGIVGVGVVERGTIDNEAIFMKIVKSQFSPFMAGILLTAILAAIMSTADSQLLVASSAFSTDIYKKHISKRSKDKTVLLVGRITIIIVAVIASLIAQNPNSSIFKIVSYAWGGFGASFGPVVLFSLYSRKITKKAAIASMVTGALTTIIFKYGLSRLGGVFTIYELIPGFILATIVLWIVTIFDKNGVSKKIKNDYAKFKTYLHSNQPIKIETYEYDDLDITQIDDDYE